MMSDLAKFVAAVLKESVAVDLEEENNKLGEENKSLKEENEALKEERDRSLTFAAAHIGRVEITGAGGTPVYAHGNMENAEVDGTSRGLRLICPDPTLCSITRMEAAEIRLNGIRITALNNYDNLTYSFDDVNADGVHYGMFSYNFEPTTHQVGGWTGLARFAVEFGPVPNPANLIGVELPEDLGELFSDFDIQEVIFDQLVLL